jgi:DDE superfamily endonuclease
MTTRCLLLVALMLQLRTISVGLHQERDPSFAKTIHEFSSCIGFIDGILVPIRRPHNETMHEKWFNGRNKIYCFNNTVVVNRNGLFIHIDGGYPGTFYDINLLRSSILCRGWRNYFTHNDYYVEYVGSGRESLPKTLRCKPFIFAIGCMLDSAFAWSGVLEF